MYNSIDFRKENKIKHSKIEHVRSNICSYLQKRNYPSIEPTEITKSQLQVYSSVEQEIGNPNSIRYRCYNCDPAVIDINFTKLLNWSREVVADEIITEIQLLIGPFFCHLYLDILQGGHPEKAAAFFFTHLSSVEKVTNDNFIKQLINSLSSENSSDYIKKDFRSNKYVLQISEKTKNEIMNFVECNCHVIFLQVLQTWFEIQVMNSQTVEMESDLVPNECCLNSKFQKILSASVELENVCNKMIYSIDISNVNSEINCGILSRYHGLFVYNQYNIVNVHPLHTLNNLSDLNNAEIIKLNGHSSKIYAITMSKNYLATASCDGKICIYRIEEFQFVNECTGHTRTVYCLKISSNELYLASGSEDNAIRLWNVSSGVFLRIFIGHEQAVYSLDFHPNCLYLISGSSDKTIRFWNIENATSLRLLHGSQGTIRSVNCHPKGKYLVSTSDDKYLRVWDLLTGKISLELYYKCAFISKLLWSKDGKLLCGAFTDKTIKVWNFKDFDHNSNKYPEVIHVAECTGTILSMEYCFGTFGVLTTNCIHPII